MNMNSAAILIEAARDTSKRNKLLSWLILTESLLAFPLLICEPIISDMLPIPDSIASHVNSKLLIYLSIAATPVPLFYLGCAIFASRIGNHTLISDYEHLPERLQTLNRAQFSSGVPTHLICQLSSLVYLTTILFLDPRKLDFLSALAKTNDALSLGIKVIGVAVASVCAITGIIQAFGYCLIKSRAKEADNASKYVYGTSERISDKHVD